MANPWLETYRAIIAAEKAGLCHDHDDAVTTPPHRDGCPGCGAETWRDTPDGGRWCEPCVIAGRMPVVAVEIWSDKLDAVLWVVADELPCDRWPGDAPVYTVSEVRRLQHQPADVLHWVHVTKQDLGARVVDVAPPKSATEGTSDAMA
jgi:hypothetical protein